MMCSLASENVIYRTEGTQRTVEPNWTWLEGVHSRRSVFYCFSSFHRTVDTPLRKAISGFKKGFRETYQTPEIENTHRSKGKQALVSECLHKSSPTRTGSKHKCTK